MKIKLIDLVLSKKAEKDIVCGKSDKEKITIGRNYDSDIVIPEDYSDVSRKHCVIYQIRDEVTVEDYNSKWGTYVNGKPLKGDECLLHDRDKLKLGSICELEVRIGEEELGIKGADLELNHLDSSAELEIDA